MYRFVTMVYKYNYSEASIQRFREGPEKVANTNMTVEYTPTVGST
jgi:hypothetical protein